MLTEEAHQRELLIVQKNSKELVSEFVDEFEWILTEDAFANNWYIDVIPFITINKAVFFTEHMGKLLKPNGKLVGVWFDIPLTGGLENRSFGRDKNLYLSYLELLFETITFERCYNSIPPRMGNELFGIFR